jgi:hypothetical protein
MLGGLDFVELTNGNKEKEVATKEMNNNGWIMKKDLMMEIICYQEIKEKIISCYWCALKNGRRD